MGRYISTDDVEKHLELDALNETDDPTLTVVNRWIEGSEAEVDILTNNRWDVHTVENELITPDCQTNDFILAKRPLRRVITFQYQDGDEWTEDWQTVSQYRIVNAAISKVRTYDFYWKEEGLRITYEAGYETIPIWLKELTLLLVEKRYIMTRLGLSAADSETVSVAVIRITDKSNASLKYRVEGLQREIDERLRLLGRSMKSRNFNLGYLSFRQSPTKRYRLY